MVYVDAPSSRFVDRFRDIERFERGPGILQIGRFCSAPRIEDLASLTLSAKARPLKSHWKVNGPWPDAAVVNVATEPSSAARLTGWSVMVGGNGINRT